MKKLLSMVVLLALVLSLVGCKDQDVDIDIKNESSEIEEEKLDETVNEEETLYSDNDRIIPRRRVVEEDPDLDIPPFLRSRDDF